MLSLKKMSHDDNIHCGATIIPDSSFSYTAVVCVFLACSLSAAAILSLPCVLLFLLPPLSLLLPLSCLFPPSVLLQQNPTSQMLYPRNLMEVIWLPINRADRGKTPGQCTTVPIMLNTSRMERKTRGALDCLVTAAGEVNTKHISEEWHKNVISIFHTL